LIGKRVLNGQTILTQKKDCIFRKCLPTRHHREAVSFFNGNYEGTEYEVDTAWEVVDDDEYLENFTYTVEEPEED